MGYPEAGRGCANKMHSNDGYKHIKLRVVELGCECYAVYIVEQTHRNEFFAIDNGVSNDHSFIAENGVELRSYGGTDVCDSKLIFMRGDDADRDNKPLMFSSEFSLNRFVSAVKEYNEYFAVNPNDIINSSACEFNSYIVE